MDKMTLDRMLEIQEQSQLCGEFLEWLQSKYSIFDKREPVYKCYGNW